MNSNWSYVPEKPKLGQNLLWPMWPSHLTLDILHVQRFCQWQQLLKVKMVWQAGRRKWPKTMTGTAQSLDTDVQRHLNLVNSFILPCSLLCGHVWSVLGRCLLCMDTWHFINKTFNSIYFIKFPDLSLKYLSGSDIHIERTKTMSMETGV